MPVISSDLALTIEAYEQAIRQKFATCERLIDDIGLLGGDPNLGSKDLKTLRGPKGNSRLQNLIKVLERADAIELWLWRVLTELRGETVYPESMLASGIAALPQNPIQRGRLRGRPRKLDKSKANAQLLRAVKSLQAVFFAHAGGRKLSDKAACETLLKIDETVQKRFRNSQLPDEDRVLHLTRRVSQAKRGLMK